MEADEAGAGADRTRERKGETTRKGRGRFLPEFSRQGIRPEGRERNRKHLLRSAVLYLAKQKNQKIWSRRRRPGKETEGWHANSFLFE